jgi:uncharacterized iron-regulated membrane protein
MADTRAGKLRRLWLNVHLWIALGLAALLVPISISGGLLVWHDEIDSMINPKRYAVSGPQVALQPSDYLAKAEPVVADDPTRPRATAIRYPEPGWPVRVVMRAQPRDADARPRLVTAYIDPPTGKVLDVVDFRASLFGFLHVFHENLTIPEHSGRQIVGWAGVGMLILSLTGIWLWWPRGDNFLRGLRWRRSPLFTLNLHSLLGFWISLPLAVVSATGIYLSFPQTARQAMSSIAPMTPQGQRFGGQIAQRTAMTADQALAAALRAEPDGKPVAVFLPVQQRDRPLTWRTQIARAGSGDIVTVMTDDHSGQTSPAAVPLSGDRAATWIRWIHEGSHSGTVWAIVVTLTGIFPTIFAVTGIIMWLRKRSDRKELAGKGAKLGAKPGAKPRLRPAE